MTGAMKDRAVALLRECIPYETYLDVALLVGGVVVCIYKSYDQNGINILGLLGRQDLRVEFSMVKDIQVSKLV